METHLSKDIKIFTFLLCVLQKYLFIIIKKN